MADATATPAAPAAGGESAAPAATPAAESAAPVAAPASVAAPAPAVTPAAEPAAPAKSAEAATPEPTKSSPSLLETADAKAKTDAKPKGEKAEVKAGEEKPAPVEPAKSDDAKKDAKAEGEKKPDDKAPAEAKKDEAAKTDPATKADAEAQPPAPIKYEPFKVPDGIKLDDKRLAQFTEIAGAAQVKQEDAQKFFDLHVQEMQNYADQVAKQQRDTWDKLNDTWKAEFRKDKDLGGNREQTTLSMAKAVIEEYGGSPDQVRELIAHTTNNGMGNYIGFIRLLHNIGTALNVYEDSLVPANPTAPKNSKSPGNRGWYDNP